MLPRRIDIVLAQARKPLRRNRRQIHMAHGQLSQMVHTMRAVRLRVCRVLGVNVRIQRFAQVVQTVQGVQDVEAGDVAAVVLVPENGGRGPVGGVGFGV